MLRRKRLDINVNHERWLISYADFVTLLFALFVVLYSISQVNEHKYEELSNSLSKLFPHTNSPLEQSEKLSANNEKYAGKNEVARNPVAKLPQLAEQFTEKLADLIGDETIQVSSNEWWLQIALSNRILFPLGSVKPSTTAEQVFLQVADILRDISNPIQVEGFTDNLVINTQQFPSNWELSTARASAIVKLLVTNGVSPTRLSAIGYGEFQPIADNSSAAGRAQNRRVVLMIGKYPRQRPKLKSVNSSAIPSVAAGSTTVMDVINRESSDGSNINSREKNNPSVSSPLSPSSTEVDSTRTVAKNPDSDSIQPITLDNGEYLFTNGIETPRERLKNTSPPAQE
ncbi:MAG: chemotaxis protein MotB [Candidatus Endobugula sp.]|jgi:chemotaxis protein MotB